MSITIIGQGVAGLFAANAFGKSSEIVDKSPGIPNNHSAVLRFRSSIFGDALGIDFKKVPVIKTYNPWGPNVAADMVAYSRKCTGVSTFRSLPIQPEIVERYISPATIIPTMVKMAKDAGVVFTNGYDAKKMAWGHGPVVSTMPMPVLMSVLKWPGPMPFFDSVPGWNIRVKLRATELYTSVYIPDPERRASRISVTGDTLIVEMPGILPEDAEKKEAISEIELTQALKALGFRHSQLGSEPVLKKQEYSKILPIDEAIRKRFIMWATDVHNVYSLGRYATWRPKLMLDDLVGDTRAIQTMIRNPSHKYNFRTSQ